MNILLKKAAVSPLLRLPALLKKDPAVVKRRLLVNRPVPFTSRV